MTVEERDNLRRALTRVPFSSYRVYRSREDADDNIFDVVTRDEALELAGEAVWWGMTEYKGKWWLSLEMGEPKQ